MNTYLQRIVDQIQDAGINENDDLTIILKDGCPAVIVVQPPTEAKPQLWIQDTEMVKLLPVNVPAS